MTIRSFTHAAATGRGALAVLAIGALLLSGGLFGCAMSDSISNSSNSISESISNSSNSSSKSSSGDSGSELAAAFRAFTVAHLKSGGTPEELQRGLGEVAASEGVSDWEAMPANFVAVGRALAESGVDAETLAAYRDTLAGADAQRRLALGRGYESVVR